MVKFLNKYAGVMAALALVVTTVPPILQIEGKIYDL